LPLRDAKTVNAWVGLGGSWTDEQIERELWASSRRTDADVARYDAALVGAPLALTGPHPDRPHYP
jgi:hypothetical protein